jgi:NitT/TauT family transport system substrate-binding protein
MKRGAAAVFSILMVVLFATTLRTSAEDATLRFAIIPVDGQAEIYYARDLGLFKKTGLDVEIQPITNGAAIIAAVVSGAADIGGSNTSSVAIAYNRNIPVTIIWAGGVYNTAAPTSICIVGKNSSLRSARDLNGKVVGTNGLRNITEFATRAWLDKNGGDSSTVKFVEFPFSDMAAALSESRIDAAVVIEPFIPDAMKTARLYSNCFDGIAPRYALTTFIAASAWAKSHPLVIAKFQDVMRTTALWAKNNHAASAAILAKETHVSVDLIARSVRSEYGTDLDPALFQPVIDATAKYSGLFASFPASELLYSAPSAGSR